MKYFHHTDDFNEYFWSELNIHEYRLWAVNIVVTELQCIEEVLAFCWKSTFQNSFIKTSNQQVSEKYLCHKKLIIILLLIATLSVAQVPCIA